MSLTEWTADTLQYDLSDEYSIRLADVKEWGLFCTVYYDMGYVGFFREEEFNSSRCSAYWIYQGERKVGGVRMEPNKMYHLFLIPPFQQGFEIVKLLKRKLMQWSDRSKRIVTFEILPSQADWFARAGFWPAEFRCRWMQRPTDHFDIEWDPRWSVQSPKIIDNGTGGLKYVNEEEIARCDLESFGGSLEATRRKQESLEDFTPDEDPNYTNEILTQASTLVYDQETGQLIANCRLCLQDDQAAVYSIGVIPSYRGRGLASQMLQRALTMLKGQYPFLRLYVMEGNDAESVYLNLGFVQGVQEIQTMYIPEEESE